MVGEDVRLESFQHLPRTVPANPCIDVSNAALRICQMNSVRQPCRPAAMLVTVYHNGRADGRQSIRLRLHPIAYCHQVLGDAVTQECHELTIQWSHTVTLT